MIIKSVVTAITILALTGCASSWRDVDTSYGDLAINVSSSEDSEPSDSTPAIDSGSFQKQLALDRGQIDHNPDMHVTLKQFIAAHELVMGGINELKASNQKIQSDLAEMKTTNQKALATAQRSLQIIEDMSTRQGTGELTVFFPVGTASLSEGTLEFDRLVRFADFLSRESKGRKIILLSIGSASSTGNHKTNLKLAKKRSELPLDILDKYLINIPHEFKKVYGTGDMYSPKNAKLKENQRYQHTRIIALFDIAQAPKVNGEVK